MFTGIIKAIGEVVGNDTDAFVLDIACPLFETNRVQLGASVAINGVCLTVRHFYQSRPMVIGFDLGSETRKLSLLTRLFVGSAVNVEFGLAFGEALDGHMVQGHVDGIAQIADIAPVENGLLFKFTCATALMRLIVPKGSIAINGVSLTINEIGQDEFSVCLVPHTLDHTNFRTCFKGDLVHVETDIIGRYLYHFYQKETSINQGFKQDEQRANGI